jgi:hypothetical protein
VKKLLSIAAALVITGAMATPSLAAPVTSSGSVLVKWNVQVNATLTLATNYDNTGAFNAVLHTVDVNNNGGTGTCVPAGPVSGTVDFGAVTTDPAKVTWCGYENAVVAKAVTNSSVAAGWNISQALAAVPTGGFTICPIGNGTLAGFGAAVAPASYTAALAFNAANQTGAFLNTTACTAASLGGVAGLTAAATNIASSQFVGATPAAGSFFGEGYVLGVPANAAAGAQTITVNYVLTAN